MVKAFQAADQPVISVDPKKQELVRSSKILAGSCGQRLHRSAAVSMILRFPSWAGSLRIGCTTGRSIWEREALEGKIPTNYGIHYFGAKTPAGSSIHGIIDEIRL